MATASNFPPQCAIATVSTVDGRFGAFYGNNSQEGCPQGNGSFVLRRSRTGWVEIDQVSGEFTVTCPSSVPTAVARDLGLCRIPPGGRLSRRVRFRSYVMGSYTRARYRPRRVLFGDRTGISGIRWSRWNRRFARGRGTLLYNNCKPNCAEARAQHYRVAITLSRVRDCNGFDRHAYHYTRFAFRYTGAKPSGLPRRYAERHTCRPGGSVGPP